MDSKQTFLTHPQAPGGAWLARLQAHGYRLTAPRRAVVDTIALSQRVLSPQEVYEQARQQHPGLGLVTVYRTLEKLEQLGLIERVHQPEGCSAFVASLGGHHHLLICRACGRFSYFGGDRLGGLVDEVEQASGYCVENHWLQLFGLCEDCRR